MARLGKYFAVAFVYFLTIPLLTFYALTLTGSTSSVSPGLSNIFLVQLQARNGTENTSSNFVIRVGYFGICAGLPGRLGCTPSSGKSSTDLTTTFFTSENSLLSSAFSTAFNNSSTSSLLQFALVLQNKIFLWLLAVSGLLVTIDLLLDLVEVFRISMRKYGRNVEKQHSSRGRLNRWSRTINWSSTALALAATVGITQATSSLQFMSDSFPNQIEVGRGTTAQVLHWLIVIFSFSITIGKTVLLPFTGSTFGEGASGAAPSGSVNIGGGPAAAGGPVII